jgi:hypothetical protein
MLGLLHCGGSEGGDYCAAQNKCLGGNDKDEAACIDKFDGEAAAAADYGCADQFTALTLCATAKAKCEGDANHKDYTTRDPANGDDRCATEQDKFDLCRRGASSLSN